MWKIMGVMVEVVDNFAFFLFIVVVEKESIQFEQIRNILFHFSGSDCDLKTRQTTTK